MSQEFNEEIDAKIYELIQTTPDSSRVMLASFFLMAAFRIFESHFSISSLGVIVSRAIDIRRKKVLLEKTAPGYEKAQEEMKKWLPPAPVSPSALP